MSEGPKPHKGTINNWISFPHHGPGLGFFIVGDAVDHPQFGSTPIRTSWVVSEDGDEIETRNSRYTLGRKAIEQ